MTKNLHVRFHREILTLRLQPQTQGTLLSAWVAQLSAASTILEKAINLICIIKVNYQQIWWGIWYQHIIFKIPPCSVQTQLPEHPILFSPLFTAKILFSIYQYLLFLSYCQRKIINLTTQEKKVRQTCTKELWETEQSRLIKNECW